ncbi:MAG: hypothetical protein QOJ63_2166 [Solirubrobacteraceae bacterium]|jgi:hypothetical protein|nr:hypothetical protein [Solirubrobacteraceae bacterium]
MKVWITTVFALALAVPALALGASAKPRVTTKGVAKLTPSTVSLLGTVDPNGAATSYLFQYGPSPLYGAVTVATPAGGGAKPVNVVVDVTGLAPATVYHYRLVAKNRNGMVKGGDRTFKTRAEPLGLTLAATPNPVPFGGPTVLAGTVTGTGNAGRQVVLQSNPFPYTQGFMTTSNVQLTNAQGAFAFPLLSVPLNTQYRVLIPTRPEVVSPIVSVGVAVKVSTLVSATRVHRGRRVRFFGTVRPARDGAQVAIQKLRGTNWITVAGTITRHAGAGFSRYSKRVRIAHGGSYRVFVGIVDGNFVSSSGRTVRIRTR